MQAILLSREEVAKRAKQLYESEIRQKVEAVHQATIFWDGEERDVRVFATGRKPLIGTAMLNEQELVIQFTEGGLITIDEL